MVDATVEDLEKRIQALEDGKQYDATKAAVQEVEKEFLVKLREIKAAMLQDTAAGAPSAATLKELQELRESNALLKAKNEKLEYRVQHVVESMEKLYQERKQLQALVGPERAEI